MDALLGFTLSLLAAAIVALALKRANVSPVAGYILAGLLIGPVFRVVDPSSEYIAIASNIGIALISFEIGLTAKLGFLRRHTQEVGMTALIEFLAITFLAAVIGITLGLPIIISVILGLMALNTSTAIAFKLVESTKKLSGRDSLQILGTGTIEDIIVMTGISLIPAFAQLGRLEIESVFYQISFVIITVLVTLVVSLQVLPKIFAFISKGNDQEITVLLLLATAIGFGWLGSYMGISFALGAFIAGLVISSIDLPSEVMNRMISLRDLFAILFFISVGLSIPVIESLAGVAYAIAIAAAVICLKFVSFTSAAWLSGRRLEKAIRMGFYMIPISEFALIVASEGYRYGFIGSDFFMASAFAVIISVVAASKLVQKDEEYANKVASFAPPRVRNGVETLAIQMLRFLNRIVLRAGEERVHLIGIGSKIAVIIVITSIGALAIQLLNELPLISEFIMILQVLVASVVSMTIAVEIFRLARSIHMMTERVLQKRGEEASKVLRVFRNVVYLVTLLLLAMIVILSSAAIVRRLLQDLGSFTANTLSFAIIFSLALIAFYFSYSKVRKMLETLEGIIDRI